MTKILVIGAGAIGSFYSAKLAQVGAEITLWCRSDYDFIKKNGIKIESYEGDFQFIPHKIIENLHEINDEFDYADNVIMRAVREFMTTDEDIFEDERYDEWEERLVEMCKDKFGERLFEIYRTTCQEDEL